MDEHDVRGLERHLAFNASQLFDRVARICSLPTFELTLLRFPSRAAPIAQTVFEKFADYRFKRIVCVDEESRCKGIISVSDLLAYFL